MKKTFKIFLSIFTCLALISASLSFSSCKKSDEDGNVSVLCTVFPIYDWVANIAKDVEGVTLSLLVDNGTDMHSFQPSFADMAEIKQSNVVIYVGGESDKWIEDALDGDTVAIKLSAIDGISLYGISSESIAHGHDHEHDHEHPESYDEHLWLSVRNAVTSCKYISEALENIDKNNAHTYQENTKSYTDKLDGIDQKLSDICANAASPVVFADRFPFVYLFNDYSVQYYAAFEGCSTDTNADFDTVIRLSEKIGEYGCRYVLTTESPIKELAEKAISESNQTEIEVLALDSMQSITAEKIEQGCSYLEIMEQNAAVLQKIF